MSGNIADALERLSLALRINSNSVWSHVVRGAALLFTGQPSEGREAMLSALRLSPRDPLNVIPSMQIGISYYFERDYLSAFGQLKQVTTRLPDFPLPTDFWRHHSANWVTMTRRKRRCGNVSPCPRPPSISTSALARPGSGLKTTNTCSKGCERPAGTRKKTRDTQPISRRLTRADS